MKTSVIQKEYLLLVIYAIFAFLFFPLGFLWFARKKDRIPGRILWCVFLLASISVFTSFLYLTLPGTKGWYNANLVGGLYTGLFLLSRSPLFLKSTSKKMTVLFSALAIYDSYVFCGLYYVRVELFKFDFSIIPPTIFVVSSLLWAWLVSYTWKRYPSKFSKA